MTKPAEGRRCRWCGRQLPIAEQTGRPREYCRQSCRQRAYELRRRQEAGTLGADEVPIRAADFERLRDGLYRLTTALEDVQADLADDGDYEAAFWHLQRAASDLAALELEVAAAP